MMELYEKYVGLVFDNRYRIERVIGIGGMAVVFKAADLLMRRTVAVKILKDEISADEQSVKRFINESKAVAMLSHQNIVNIYDVSVRENIKYIVMEFVEGITLKNYMQHREVLNLREIISYTTQILRALEHAHNKGIVHRDIKPQNIMLLKNGVIKVMDFGIAKLPNAETVTMTDKAIGTVYYISPEQASGHEIDARSDLYSLGIMMYEMSTGQLPFTADTPVSVALMQVNDSPTPPREINPHIPVGLEQIIMRAIEKDPTERYQSAEEMLGHLLKLRENPKIIFKENKSLKNKQKSKNPQSKKKTSRSMFPIIMGVTTAFFITAGISGYYIIDKLFLNGSMNNYVNFEIENFVGVTYTKELEDWFEKSEYFEVPTVNYSYSDTVEEGKIISQDPKAGEIHKVRPGKQECEITLDVSLGVQKLVLDDYTVRDYRLVETELKRLGLKVKIEKVSNSIYEIGYVVKTEPEAGTEMQTDDTVTIYVSQGSDAVNTMVPNFVGLNEAQAVMKLAEYSLTAGDVKYVKSDSAAGTVVSQSLVAWKEAAEYSAVDFTVSGGASYSGDGYTLPTDEDKKGGGESTKETESVDDSGLDSESAFDSADGDATDINDMTGTDESQKESGDAPFINDDWFDFGDGN